MWARVYGGVMDYQTLSPWTGLERPDGFQSCFHLKANSNDLSSNGEIHLRTNPINYGLK